jgi:hypothetical protein
MLRLVVCVKTFFSVFKLCRLAVASTAAVCVFQVRVNGVEYMPSSACGNKKLAKAQAAAICLQEMGLIPRDFVVTG